MIGLFLYLSFFVLGCFLGFIVVKEMRVETLFKPNRSFHIKLFYLVSSLVVGNTIGLIFYVIYNLAQTIQQFN